MKITRRCYFRLVKVGFNSWQCLDNCFENIVMA
jgi:hypothetical protein